MLEIALALIPLFFLLGSLLLGRYPGLATIVRISERFMPSRGARPARSQRRPRAPRSRIPSGGLLIAWGLARRPPPLVS